MAAFVLLAAASPSSAQTLLTDQLRAKTSTIATEVRLRRQRPANAMESIEDSVRNVLQPGSKPDLYVLLIEANASGRVVNVFKSEADEARVDKQIGVPAGGGTTSLASKGSTPAILGLAVENGALDRTISGTTVSFVGRPVQIIQALQKATFTQSFKEIEANASLGALNRFSFGFGFDTSRDNTTNTFTGRANQLSSYFARFDVINYRDPRNKRFDDQWATLQAGVAQDMALALNRAYDVITGSPLFQPRFDAWLAPTTTAIADAIRAGQSDATVAAVFDQQLADFPSFGDLPGAVEAASGFAAAATRMLEARDNILSFVGTSPIVTLQYTGVRATVATAPLLQLPDTSNLTVIAELAPCHGCGFTLNGSATIFNTVPVNTTASRLRDVIVSAQLDVPVNASVGQLGNVVLTFAFQYKHLPNDIIAIAVPGQPASTLVTTSVDAAFKGDLIFGQARLTFPVKGTGVKIPLSVTFSNRTELIKESTVRANLGFTFDFDTIVSKLKP